MQRLTPIQQRSLMLICIALFGLGACKRIERGTPTAVTEALAQVRAQHCPDQRLGVFNIDVVVRGANLKLTGELSDPLAKTSLMQAVKAAVPHFKVEEEIQLLPDPRLGERRFGLVRVSVANMRKAPRHTAALVNQVLAGNEVALLKAEGDWYYAHTTDNYHGWIAAGSLWRCSQNALEEWHAADRIAYTQLHGVIYTEMNENSLPVSEVVWGNLLRRLATIKPRSPRSGQAWVKVALPDGREGFLPQAVVAERLAIYPDQPADPARVIATARRLVGVPFLWGGNSTHGFDAAGFVQTVFRLNGIALPRDADQQASAGTPIDLDSRFSRLQPADLLFFGESDTQIDHVGISLGGPRFIHVADFVKISSLNSADPEFDRAWQDRFQFGRRYIDEASANSRKRQND